MSNPEIILKLVNKKEWDKVIKKLKYVYRELLSQYIEHDRLLVS